MSIPNIQSMDTLTAADWVDRGDQYFAAEQWDEANVAYYSALAMDPRSRRALIGRAIALRKGQFDYVQATRLLNRLLFYYPADVEALTEYGELHAEQYDHARAVDYFDQALKADPTNRRALEGKIRSLLAQGLTVPARDAIASATLEAVSEPWLKCVQARVYAAEGAYDSAVEAFFDADALPQLYETLGQVGDKKTKDLFADAIISRLGDQAEALRAVRDAHTVWLDKDAAIRVLTQLVAVDPKDENAHVDLITLLANRERYEEAEAAYANAVQALGRTTDALLVARALALFSNNRRDFAIETLASVQDHDRLIAALDEVPDDDVSPTIDSLLERQADRGPFCKRAADRLIAAGNVTRALELLDDALQGSPGDIEALAMKGNILLEQHRLGDVDDLLKSAYAQGVSDSPELLAIEARLLIARERYLDAVQVAARAGKEAEVHQQMTLLLQHGHLTKAQKLVDAALQHDPRSTPFLEAQADLLTRQRSYAKAAEVWHRLRQNNPEDLNLRLREAGALRMAREFARAAEVVQQGLRQATQDDRYTFVKELGLVHYMQGQYAEAIRAWDEVLLEKVDDGFAHLWKIRALRVSGNRADAELAAKKAIDANLFDGYFRGEIACEMGRLHEARNEWQAAHDRYCEALEADDTLIEPHYLKANVLLQLNRHAEAHALLEQVIKDRGNEIEVRANAGWFYLLQKDFKNAQEQFQEIFRRSPDDYTAINGLGGVHFMQREYALAEQHFKRALQIDQGEEALWTNVAWALVRQVNARHPRKETMLADAEVHCRKAIEIAPKSASAHACLGIIAFKRGRLMECEEKLKYANELDPRELNSTDLGALYAYLGRYEDAREILEKGRALDRYDATLRVELGSVYMQLHRPAEAIMVLKEACAIEPAAVEPVRSLSLAVLAAGDSAEALRILRRAVRNHDPALASALRVTLCRVLTEIGEKAEDPDLFTEAVREIRLAIAARPNESEAYFHAGVVYSKQGDHRAARKAFKSCLELDGNNFDAEENLRKVKAAMVQEAGRSRITIWLGTTVGIVCLALFVTMWWIYLGQPIPTSKDAMRQIDSAMVLTMSPILLALVIVALLLPWLTRFKLGGVEAEITQPKDQVSAGPRGSVAVNFGSASMHEGPK